ncbi:hypothetical protein TI04_11770 [Achromatium sp. WMS2]|nr:hypothetical protein TI04_11770 [Achromatium sp. WMS2]
MIAGCTGNGVKYVPLPLTFTDSAEFDEILSAALLSSEDPVVVKVAFNENSLPKRIEHWFAMVNDSGGKVQMRTKLDVRDGNGNILFFYELLKRVFNVGYNRELYKPAERYDAVLSKDDDTGQITKLEFKLRANVVGTN